MGQLQAVRGQVHEIVAAFLLLVPAAGGCAQSAESDPFSHRAGGTQRAHAAVVTAASASDGAVLAKAAQQMTERDYEAAADALSTIPPEQRSSRGAYLLGRALEALGRHGPAADALPHSDRDLPAAVVDDVTKRRATLLAQASRCDEALPRLKALIAERSTPVLLVHAGRCEQQLEQHGAAIEYLERALAEDSRGRYVDRIELQLRLAELKQAQNDNRSAMDTLRRLFIAHPADRRADEVRERLQALGKKDPSLGKPLSLSPEEAQAQAQALFDAKAYEEAAAAYSAMKAPRDKAERATLLYQHGMALFRSRKQYKEAARVLQRAAHLGGKHEATAAFHAARALARANRDRAAVRAFAKFIKAHPRSPHVPDAAYLEAWLSTRHGFPRARKLMEAFIAGPYGRRAPGLRTEAQFQLAMEALRRRRSQEAQKLFLDYSEGRGEMARQRGLYWAAQAASLGKHTAQASKYYEEIRQLDPLHYYAQLSTLRLHEAKKAPEPVLAAAGDPAEVPEAPLPPLARFYVELGLIDDAASALRATEPHAIHRRKARLSEVLPWAVSYGAMGDHNRAYRLLGPFFSQFHTRPARGMDHVAWNLSYARPSTDAVERANQRFGTDPELIYSVMRKESAFNPQVVSYADAIGLLQLLPETAATLAVGLGELKSESNFDRRRLLKPAENIWLGAAYLKELQERYPQHPALAIAAYNAGTHQVDQWLRTERPRRKRAPFPLDLFVERIPITQTRNYVRRVLSNWASYRYLGGKEERPSWGLTL